MYRLKSGGTVRTRRFRPTAPMIMMMTAVYTTTHKCSLSPTSLLPVYTPRPVFYGPQAGVAQRPCLVLDWPTIGSI